MGQIALKRCEDLSQYAPNDHMLSVADKNFYYYNAMCKVFSPPARPLRQEIALFLQAIQPASIVAQYGSPNAFGFGCAQFATIHALAQCLLQDAPSIAGTQPVDLRHPNPIRAVEELGGWGHIQRCLCATQHLMVAKKRDTIRKVEIDVFIDGCQVGSLRCIGIGLMQQYNRHVTILFSLKDSTQVERVCQQHISIGIAIAGMKLDGKFLPGSLLKDDMQQGIKKWFMHQAQMPLHTDKTTSLRKGGSNSKLVPGADVEARSIRDDAFQSDIALPPHILQRFFERLDHGG